MKVNKTDSELLQKAIALATKAHRKQIRFNGEPYILHPMRVMLKMESAEMMVIAVLHDVIEDTKIMFNDVIDIGFHAGMVDVLECLTRRKLESYSNYISRIAESKFATTVKLADLKDNLAILNLPEIALRDIKRIEKHYTAYKFLVGE